MRVHSYLIVALTFLTASLLSVAHAAPITYTLTGRVTGTIGSINLTEPFTTLTDTPFTWTLTGDTTARTTVSGGTLGVTAISDTLEISGFGTAMVTLPLVAADFPDFGFFAFTDSAVAHGIAFIDAELVGYNGLTSIGPLSVDFDGAGAVPTDQGIFVIDSIDDLVFQASTVPEPLTLALFGAGLAGIGALRRHKQQA